MDIVCESKEFFFFTKECVELSYISSIISSDSLLPYSKSYLILILKPPLRCYTYLMQIMKKLGAAEKIPPIIESRYALKEQFGELDRNSR